jgi:hypothetical protein
MSEFIQAVWPWMLTVAVNVLVVFSILYVGTLVTGKSESEVQKDRIIANALSRVGVEEGPCHG